MGGKDNSRYRFQRLFRGAHEVGVPYPQYTESLPFEPGGAGRVVVGRVGVLAAVEFDHEARAQADEVDDVWANGVLVARFVQIEG